VSLEAVRGCSIFCFHTRKASARRELEAGVKRKKEEKEKKKKKKKRRHIQEQPGCSFLSV
jgi:hypothetical protein